MLGIPRVALLFLTRGPMHHEEMWRLWLGSAAGQLPARSAQASWASGLMLSSTSGFELAGANQETDVHMLLVLHDHKAIVRAAGRSLVLCRKRCALQTLHTTGPCSGLAPLHRTGQRIGLAR